MSDCSFLELQLPVIVKLLAFENLAVFVLAELTQFALDPVPQSLSLHRLVVSSTVKVKMIFTTDESKAKSHPSLTLLV